MEHCIATFAQAQPESVFGLAVKGGIMMIPIAICSLVVVTVVLERLSILRLSRIVPSGFEPGLESAISEGGAAAGAAYCASHPSPIARIIAAGVTKLSLGHDIVERHISAAGESEIYLLRKRLRGLSVVAAVAPLLGLTGTIFGMIKAFQTVAGSGDSLGKAELLAGGIYEAMISTAAGLLVAMPTIVLYHYLASRIDRVARELDRIAVGFVERHALHVFGISAAPTIAVDTPDSSADGTLLAASVRS